MFCCRAGNHTRHFSIGSTCAGQERGQRVYPVDVPTWRDANGLRPTEGDGSQIVVVVCDDSGQLAALVESENDVCDLPRGAWKLRRYAVESVAGDAKGNYFKSYNSIERMAIAVMAIAYPDYSSTELTDHILRSVRTTRMITIPSRFHSL